MHSIHLNIDDSIYDKLIGFLQILPKEKIEIVSDEDIMNISFEEAKRKVSRAINNIPNNEGVDLNTAIDKVLHS
ncbi:MAG TPA: hypothetical protein PLM93_03245 [Sulfuricurvum sp.]|nr:MAG: hypothetical protein B7Y30_02420 [Campylobacterales bacterium 16-40-21]OZA04179.1 MAG: hypothetical protein B7X89_01095 [Sulfuricurvum sp. 17-40-25]HQS66190.1 hypothetical protein [Sulfuricurvum sp.]HQT35554.1 hypothetical protein [Sulfuricurvum sp.]